MNLEVLEWGSDRVHEGLVVSHQMPIVSLQRSLRMQWCHVRRGLSNGLSSPTYAAHNLPMKCIQQLSPLQAS